MGGADYAVGLFVCLSYICVNGHLIGQLIGTARGRGSRLDLGEHVVPGPVKAGGETAEYDRVPAEH